MRRYISSGIDRIAIIVATARERDNLQRELDPNRDRFLIISSRQVVAGKKFNTVIVSDSFLRRKFEASLQEAAAMDVWLNNDVRMRLDHPDARMVYL